MRRAKSARNYIYDKSIRKFSDLTEEEKGVIFYPRFSIFNLAEYFHQYRFNKVYPVFRRCAVRLPRLYIVWIWIVSFMNISFYTISFGISILNY